MQLGTIKRHPLKRESELISQFEHEELLFYIVSNLQMPLFQTQQIQIAQKWTMRSPKILESRCLNAQIG